MAREGWEVPSAKFSTILLEALIRRREATLLCAVREIQTILTLAKRPHEFKLADMVGAHLYRLLNPGPEQDSR